MSLVTRGLISGPIVTWGLGLGLLIAPDFICPEKLTIYRAVDSNIISKIIDSSVIETDVVLITTIETVVNQIIESELDKTQITALLDQLSVQEGADRGIITWVADSSNIYKSTDSLTMSQLSDSTLVVKIIDRSSALIGIDSNQVEAQQEYTIKGC